MMHADAAANTFQKLEKLFHKFADNKGIMSRFHYRHTFYGLARATLPDCVVLPQKTDYCVTLTSLHDEYGCFVSLPRGVPDQSMTFDVFMEALWYLSLVVPMQIQLELMSSGRRQLLACKRPRTAAYSKLTTETWELVAPIITKGLPNGDDLFKHTTIDAVCDFITTSCAKSCGVSIEKELVMQYAAQLTNFYDMSDFLALTIARTAVMDELLGKRVARMVRIALSYSNYDNGDPPPITRDDVNAIARELAHTQQELTKYRIAARDGPVKHVDYEDIAARSAQSLIQPRYVSFAKGSESHHVEIAKAAVRYATNNNVAFKHCANTLAEAEHVLNTIQKARLDETADNVSQLFSDRTLAVNCTLIDEALDRLEAESYEKAPTRFGLAYTKYM